MKQTIALSNDKCQLSNAQTRIQNLVKDLRSKEFFAKISYGFQCLTINGS